MRKQLNEIQYARAFAMFSVLFVHCTSNGIVVLNSQSSFYPVYTTLNTIGKLGVPVFFCLSGLVLFYAYFKREFTRELVIDFYKKRLKYIVIPYIVISSIYVTYYNFLYYSYPSAGEMLKSYYTFIIHGNASYHTYFLYVLIQFYLLFPMMLWLVKKITFIKPWIFIIGLVIQLGFWKLNIQYGWATNTAILFVSYISFFLLGGQLGIYYLQIREWMINKKGLLLSVFGLGYLVVISMLAIMDYHLFSNTFSELVQKVSFFSVSGVQTMLWMTQGILASIVLILIGLFINEYKIEKVKSFLLEIAACSFGIYLFHPLVLAYIGKLFVTSNSMLFHVFQLMIFVLVFIFSWIITKIIKKLSFGWIFIGK